LRAPSPRNITTAIEQWFASNQRPLPWRRDYDPYHVWVSEVMLQQTRMDVVLPYFDKFLARFPTVHDLAAASLDDVVALWSGLGYYRRARMLHAGAQHVVKNLDGKLPREASALRTIPGIGRYTAGAISSTAFEERAPIVDGNVMRVLARVFAIEQSLKSSALEKAVWSRSEELVAACADPRAFNQGLMELGASICTPRNAKCVACPLRNQCIAFRDDRVHELPVAAEKAETRALTIPLFIVTDRKRRVLLIRAAGPLMDAMFHLPHGVPDLIPSICTTATRTTPLGRFTHTVTTRRIEFEVFDAELGGAIADAAEARWVDPDDLTAVPHPSYVVKALRVAGLRGGGKMREG
jgi:A/G-specific adenine glycosylase